MLWEMYCVVQGQERTANTFHELVKNRPGKGKCYLALVGRTDLWVAQHSIFQLGIGRGVLKISIEDMLEDMSVTHTLRIIASEPKSKDVQFQ